MDKVRGLLGIRRIDRMLNACVRGLCDVNKGMNQRIDERVLQQFGHMERMED